MVIGKYGNKNSPIGELAGMSIKDPFMKITPKTSGAVVAPKPTGGFSRLPESEQVSPLSRQETKGDSRLDTLMFEAGFEKSPTGGYVKRGGSQLIDLNKLKQDLRKQGKTTEAEALDALQFKEQYGILQEDILKQEELKEVPIPRAEDITGETANIFSESGKTLLGTNSNVAQAMVGATRLKELRSNEALQNELLDLTKYMTENGLRPDQVTDDPLLQELLALKLTERDIQVLKDGRAEVKDFAIQVEGLPILGKLKNQAGEALVPSTAYSKINDLDSKVTKLTSKMDNWSEAISKNPQLAEQYDDLIADAEQEIYDAQSRIKLMIIQSPILQNSPEEVENIQENLDKGLIKTAKLRSQVIQVKYVQ